MSFLEDAVVVMQQASAMPLVTYKTRKGVVA
jgi:hypothetical protein